jgi:hypothetical protein
MTLAQFLARGVPGKHGRLQQKRMVAAMAYFGDADATGHLHIVPRIGAPTLCGIADGVASPTGWLPYHPECLDAVHEMALRENAARGNRDRQGRYAPAS